VDLTIQIAQLFQDPQRKEIFLVSQRIVHPNTTTIALAEMKRNTTGQLIDVQTRDAMTVESPLLDAFVLGFLGLPPLKGS
jgi:hypothetical protein